MVPIIANGYGIKVRKQGTSEDIMEYHNEIIDPLVKRIGIHEDKLDTVGRMLST